MQRTVRIALVVSTCLLIGFLSGLATQKGVNTWYVTQVKPFYNPPNWVFGPVWTVLYILMGISGGLIWNKIETHEKQVKEAFKYFIYQLALNALWSILFFVFFNPFLALIEIILLWLVIFETYKLFKKIDRMAAYLLIPYLAWVGFATFLNAGIWWLNR